MTKEEAIAVLEDSFARPCATPDYGASDREAFLIEEKKKLLSLVIEPIEVVATTSSWSQRHGSLHESSYVMWAVAGTDGSWLLFEPKATEFALAHGSLVPGQRLELVGFSSTDALAEWRG